ncbi:MAG: ribosomal protein S18-alanine N-acetyltransferase [Oleiphilus sp.]
MTSADYLGAHGALSINPMNHAMLDDVMRIEGLAYPFPWKRSMFETSLSGKDSCLVLKLDGVLVGYAIVSYILDEAHLLNICIHPDYEGQGLGRALLKFLLSSAMQNQCSLFFLEVRVSNVRAIELYFSEGFNEVGIRPNYYPGNKGREDAVLMTLDLSVNEVV